MYLNCSHQKHYSTQNAPNTGLSPDPLGELLTALCRPPYSWIKGILHLREGSGGKRGEVKGTGRGSPDKPLIEVHDDISECCSLLSPSSCVRCSLLTAPLTSTWPHLNSDVGLEELSLCYSIV